MTVRPRETKDEPAQVDIYRTLIYRGLSETADIHVTDYREKGVAVHFNGKQLSRD
jgi:hypothetical protein